MPKPRLSRALAFGAVEVFLEYTMRRVGHPRGTPAPGHPRPRAIGTSGTPRPRGHPGPRQCVLECTIGQPPGEGYINAGLDESKCHGRQDVRCTSWTSGSTDYEVCIPTCGRDSKCDGRSCDPRSGVCVDSPNTGLPTGTVCGDEAPNEDGCAGVCQTFTGETDAICTSPCVLDGDDYTECDSDAQCTDTACGPKCLEFYPQTCGQGGGGGGRGGGGGGSPCDLIFPLGNLAPGTGGGRRQQQFAGINGRPQLSSRSKPC